MDERKRKLSLLRIILRGVIFLSLTGAFVYIFKKGYQVHSSFDFVPILIVGLFLILYVLALSITIAGILINARFALILVLFHTFVTFLLTYFQNTGQLNYEWWDIKPTIGSVLVTMVILGIIGVISWLSNREIEKALARVYESEENLKKERDSLDIKVEQRTRELKRVQLEKILHLYRLADFGEMAAGLFHDLVNPLNVVMLNLEELNDREKSVMARRALSGVKRMEQYVESARKQIQRQEVKEFFSLNKEINQSLKMLAYKTRKSQIKLSFLAKKQFGLRGNPLRFNELVTNLTTNAIDAYEKINRKKNRRIILKLGNQDNKIILTVTDFGCGILRKDIKKIFEPFFTTKSVGKGTGIGLSISKDIVEKEFNGTIEVKSRRNQGTTFTVRFPLH
ncbi:GHKL domain-containing protein [Candidatus Roizmanbacteria bacterium]|nr:GHKL domain-containing protein [Candidatus Roizmanbacteria bacterium]